jgi:hypothetical protein
VRRAVGVGVLRVHELLRTRAAASAWAASHPEISSGILGQARALQTGIGIFGQLLSQSAPGYRTWCRGHNTTPAGRSRARRALRGIGEQVAKAGEAIAG